MNRPPAFSPPRPPTGTRRVPRSRTEAAIELVRVEFERTRLSRDLTHLQSRALVSGRALELYDTRAAALLKSLSNIGEEPS